MMIRFSLLLVSIVVGSIRGFCRTRVGSTEIGGKQTLLRLRIEAFLVPLDLWKDESYMLVGFDAAPSRVCNENT